MIHNNSTRFFLFFLLISLLVGCTDYFEQEVPTPIPTVVVDTTVRQVSAEGFIMPVRDTNISFEVGGRLTKVMFAEGDHVKAGDVVAYLDDSDQKLALLESENNLNIAQASLAEVKLGATAEEIMEAEIAVKQAQARLTSLLAAPTYGEIAEAKAMINTQKKILEQALAGPRPESLTIAESTLEQAQANLRLAQYQYDQVAYHNDSLAVEEVVIAFQKATLAYQNAEANYNVAIAGARPEQIAVLEAQISEAETALARVLAQATPEEISQCQAEIELAKATLNLVKADIPPEPIAVVAAGIAEAQVAITKAEHDLTKRVVVAPFDGVIIDVPTDDGQFVAPGQAIMVLAEIIEWHVETDDLTELDIVHVREGQSVKIMVDSLPNADLEGTVTRVKPVAEVKAGDVTYTVEIDFTGDGSTDSRLRWGMTVFVEIDVEK
ncbi:MAG: hypothetical protein B6242_03415 [Anaerolineaceae bacterium 4572_78]|nr:MAG: hypothetical protein B6242_03415 [Anaerolineaceae bacterium 4572_78]